MVNSADKSKIEVIKYKGDEIKKASSAGFEPARASPTDF